MKKIIAILLFASLAIGFSSTDLHAQRYDEAQYDYADSNTGTVYQLYLRFKGYQVSVWMKAFSAKEWTTYQVLETNDNVITVKNKNLTYHLKLDPNNEDVVVVYSSDYKHSWKYLKKGK